MVNTTEASNSDSVNQLFKQAQLLYCQVYSPNVYTYLNKQDMEKIYTTSSILKRIVKELELRNNT